MSDDQQKRAQSITPAERKSPADRAREIQELQRQSQSAPVQVQRPAAEVAQPRPAVMAPNIARVAEAQKAAEKLGPGRTSASEQSVYAKMQADPAALFGGSGPRIEVTGNPWKVIDFSAFVPMVFVPQGPVANYQPQVPNNAVRTEQGLLFQASLNAKDGAEPPQQRAVLVNDTGGVIGAECRSPSELSRLLSSTPAMADAIAANAFDGGGKGARVRSVNPGREGAFSVSVERGGDVKSVSVNNFGLPERPNLIVADYWLDRFDAAA